MTNINKFNEFITPFILSILFSILFVIGCSDLSDFNEINNPLIYQNPKDGLEILIKDPKDITQSIDFTFISAEPTDAVSDYVLKINDLEIDKYSTVGKGIKSGDIITFTYALYDDEVNLKLEPRDEPYTWQILAVNKFQISKGIGYIDSDGNFQTEGFDGTKIESVNFKICVETPVTPVPVPTPIPTSTDCGTTICTSSNTWTWSSVEGATSYETELTPAGATLNDTDLSDTQASYDDLVPGQTYTFRVRAKNDTTFSEWSESTCQTTVKGATSYPTDFNASMTNGVSFNPGDTQTLNWNAIIDITQYTVNIYTASGNPASSISGYPTTTASNTINLNIIPSTSDTTYYWSISGIYNGTCMNTTASGEASFTIKAVSIPTVTTGDTECTNGFDCDNNIVFNWTAVTGATGYRYDVNGTTTDVTSGTLTKTISGTVGSTVTFKVSPLVNGTPVAWSTTCNTPINIDGPINVPTPSSPANNATSVSSPQNISWTVATPNPGNTLYTLYINTNLMCNFTPANCTNPQTATPNLNTTFSFTEDGTGYYWRVKAEINGHCSQWSSASIFGARNPCNGPTTVSKPWAITGNTTKLYVAEGGVEEVPIDAKTVIYNKSTLASEEYYEIKNGNRPNKSSDVSAITGIIHNGTNIYIIVTGGPDAFMGEAEIIKLTSACGMSDATTDFNAPLICSDTYFNVSLYGIASGLTYDGSNMYIGANFVPTLWYSRRPEIYRIPAAGGGFADQRYRLHTACSGFTTHDWGIIHIASNPSVASGHLFATLAANGYADDNDSMPGVHYTPATKGVSYFKRWDYGTEDVAETINTNSNEFPCGIYALAKGSSNYVVISTNSNNLQRFVWNGSNYVWQANIAGTSCSPALNQPAGIWVDTDGTAYVTNYGANNIAKCMGVLP